MVNLMGVLRPQKPFNKSSLFDQQLQNENRLFIDSDDVNPPVNHI